MFRYSMCLIIWLEFGERYIFRMNKELYTTRRNKIV
jgi:hypothetical protein